MSGLAHYLTQLKGRSTGQDKWGNAHAYAEVPDWALRQALEREARLVETLEYIADEESVWRFKRDPLEHARSVVDEMRDMARAALTTANEPTDAGRLAPTEAPR